MENISLLKMIKIMRFTIFILFLSLSQAFAVDSYSQQTKLSLDLKNAKVEEVLDKIEKSSEFFFMYNKGMVDVERKIDIQVEEKGINQILEWNLPQEDRKRLEEAAATSRTECEAVESALGAG